MTVRENYVLDAPDGSRPFDAVEIEGDLKNMWKRAAAGGDSPSQGGAVYRAALANLVVPLDPALGSKVAPMLVVPGSRPSKGFGTCAFR